MPPVSSINVLVVDDDASIRRLMNHRLAHMGYRVVEAEDGEQALRRIGAESFDLVLLDVMMPGVDGLNVLKTVRQQHSATSLPIIMVTAKDKGEDVIGALHLGANDYIIKPFDFQMLAQRIGVHLKLKAGRDKIVGSYRLLDKIGAGGMGVVYEAEEVEGNRRVALKILPRSMTIDDVFVERFLREAHLAQRVAHPNVVAVYDTGKLDETYYIAMELVDGKDLGEMCENTPMDPPKALEIVRQVADGLEAMKDAGVVHRDIKPENIIVGRNGTAKITDFGIARDLSVKNRMTNTGVGVGSVMYASPEQIYGGGDFRADIYSLGCTLYFMVNGKDPFPNDLPLDTLLRRKMARPPRLEPYRSWVPDGVRTVIARMMAGRVGGRFDSYEDLDAALKDAGEVAQPLRPVQGRWWVGAAMTAAVVAVSILLWRIWTYG
ncbi:MAG: hypothetical protein A2289_10915 [Deltaproteobacteria bacterium RIFOXYA12_FULL_58_15]|nr:MAG: hypothetical protein A2289_10915 [Deltaproteobacteria bacterium RIFOXYA12_FULL_58_15]OGR09923.1 MAG: hypothetical protein A2341_27385 [Deltaproteobacteria bacterium RIFOXYB12_FULL_58_9]